MPRSSRTPQKPCQIKGVLDRGRAAPARHLGASETPRGIGSNVARPQRAEMALIDLANPSRFVELVERVLPWLAAATVIAFAVGLRGAWLSPDDYQQGATVKIMYIHVPNAWLSMFVWGVMSAAALGTLVWRHPLADVAAKCAAPLGAAFTFVALVTGSLWG